MFQQLGVELVMVVMVPAVEGIDNVWKVVVSCCAALEVSDAFVGYCAKCLSIL